MQDLKRASITIRLGEDLLHTLRVEAAKRPQSVNAEIVQRLVESLVRPQVNSLPMDGSFTQEEMSLIGLWREMNYKERAAILSVAERIVDHAPVASSWTPPSHQMLPRQDNRSGIATSSEIIDAWNAISDEDRVALSIAIRNALIASSRDAS
ncbi:hypothetical protein AA101099_1868 [Neoasaia chiangmaiensis NBRC 101099]|uniref:Uncharacterized protein n=2 Tax=Neoasaia chiangmaiensis TaxID=320497 RepID=A0A1U9KQQ4_9PROT|nr:hypothetical protein [Neoasaia chiangmaiensis]AQS88191.1 hypothetical protein A0U93_09825 [Neoasaia chiangmaiensis]GBR39901.1 hypothetical protein AA101099_1868 [Neoasaia chiangmaiensis NBRC 101099]GEN14792.1 hypothetical protein NCH01_12230 [Neoasaia chiangmaiensis]